MSVEVVAPEVSVAPAAAEPWPKPAQAWYAIFIFALALMVDFLDRGIVGLLVRSIEQDLHLNDFQISLVTGFAYVSIYAIVGLPIARWADYGTRRNIVAAGVAVWSLMTAFCGLAQNFWQLFFCRVGVGVGEACNGPPVFSMISDLFPREKLPRAIAVLNFGFIAGTGLAAILGGTVIRALANVREVRVPLIGALHPWQMTFIVVGLIGLVVALLMGTVKEPLRRGRYSGSAGHGTLPVREIARFVVDNRGTYAPMFLGLGFNVVMAFGFSVWAAEFFRRTFAWAPADFAITSGLITIIVAPVGAIFGSWLAERFYREGKNDANMRVVLLSFAFNAPGLFPADPGAERPHSLRYLRLHPVCRDVGAGADECCPAGRDAGTKCAPRSQRFLCSSSISWGSGWGRRSSPRSPNTCFTIRPSCATRSQASSRCSGPLGIRIDLVGSEVVRPQRRQGARRGDDGDRTGAAYLVIEQGEGVT
jgi:MFS family permease